MSGSPYTQNGTRAEPSGGQRRRTPTGALPIRSPPLRSCRPGPMLPAHRGLGTPPGAGGPALAGVAAAGTVSRVARHVAPQADGRAASSVGAGVAEEG